MSHIGIRFTAIGRTAAGLGRTASGKTVIADRPAGVAGGQGLGCNGGELLASALGGCFWNDLHYMADASGTPINVHAVDAEVELAGNPPRIVRARIIARLDAEPGSETRNIFEAACATSTVANSLLPAIPITFDLQPSGSHP